MNKKEQWEIIRAANERIVKGMYEYFDKNGWGLYQFYLYIQIGVTQSHEAVMELVFQNIVMSYFHLRILDEEYSSDEAFIKAVLAFHDSTIETIGMKHGLESSATFDA